jgi:6,7-dimethyl-8-ribityllumazine synthase
MREKAEKAANACALEVTDVVWISGSMEAPLAAKRLLSR